MWIALGLAKDALAVAIAAGMAVSQVTPRHVFRLAFHFGLFQFMMPILGWLAGRGLAERVGVYSPWAVASLLGFVGGKMIWDSRRRDPARPRPDPTRGVMLITLSVATSLDALAVGVSMALMGVSVWGPSIVIGLCAAGLTAVGVGFGSRLGPQWEHWADLCGGAVLLAVGARILWVHLS